MLIKRQTLRYNIKFRTGQISRLLERVTENECVEFPLNVLPKVWLNNNPEESGKRSTSLDLDLPRSEERLPAKKSMEKKLRSRLKTYKSEGEVSGFLSLDIIKRAIAQNFSVKRGKALRGCTRAWACSSRTHFK